MVHTSVTADGITYEDWLPVMDYSNRSMKSQGYSVQVYDKYKKQYVEKKVEAATTFDVNSAIQRSMVRCLARHGLGLYIYNGFDHLSDETSETTPQQQTMKPVASAPTMQTAVSTDTLTTLRNAINATTDVASLVNIYLENTSQIEANPEIKAMLTSRKQALQSISKAA